MIAQLPLTFGNSVVATADAERSYFGDRARRVRPNRLAGSIAGANLVAGLTHGLPLCHGAGGVTAHVKLGARTAGATAAAGALYLLLGVAFGASLPAVLHLLLPGRSRACSSTSRSSTRSSRRASRARPIAFLRPA